nr:hypothetical protein TetV2_00235 [Oceanusvirus sp.]
MNDRTVFDLCRIHYMGVPKLFEKEVTGRKGAEYLPSPLLSVEACIAELNGNAFIEVPRNDLFRLSCMEGGASRIVSVYVNISQFGLTAAEIHDRMTSRRS